MEQQTLHLLDSSTFINAMIIKQLPNLLALKTRINFCEYVYRVELNNNKYKETRQEAQKLVNDGRVGISNLTLDDLDRIAGLDKPRRIGFGEIACAVVAERENGRVLCDDVRARKWIIKRIASLKWESIEDILIQAAFKCLISEYDLDKHQKVLEENNYKCQVHLRHTYLMQRANVR